MGTYLEGIPRFHILKAFSEKLLTQVDSKTGLVSKLVGKAGLPCAMNVILHIRQWTGYYAPVVAHLASSIASLSVHITSLLTEQQQDTEHIQ